MGQTSLKKLTATEKRLAIDRPAHPGRQAEIALERPAARPFGPGSHPPDRPGQEDDAEMEHLLTALRDDLQPCGALEEILVEKIAVCYWRLRRVLRAENGEIRAGLDDAPRSLRFQLTTQAVLAAEKGREQPSLLQANSFGLEALLEYLARLQSEVAENKAISKASLRLLAKYFGDGPDGLAARCALAQSADSNTHPDGPESALTTTNSSENLLRLLEVEKTKLNETLRDVQQDEFERLESDFDRLSLLKEAEKIVRYETAIERQLNRALYHLEKAQEGIKSRK